MKLAWFKKPRHYVLVGLLGLAICGLLLCIAEYMVGAPDQSTLFYRQSVWALGALILFIPSVAALVRGVWGSIQERRARRLGE